MHRQLLAIGLALLGVGAATLLRSEPGPVETSSEGVLPETVTASPLAEPRPTTSPPRPEKRAARPRALRIPKLGLQRPIERAGVDRRTGLMTVPSTAGGIAWYRHGPAPGEPGSAVLAAHVDFDGRTGAFFRLAELRPKDLVMVEDRKGGVRRFRVAAVRSYRKDRLPEGLFGRSGSPVLTLITCGGAFDPGARSYERNVVVIAEPVVRRPSGASARLGPEDR